MKKNKTKSGFALVLLLAVIISSLPGNYAHAEDGGWGSFFDSDGNLKPGVIEAGEITKSVDWMPDFPDWTGLNLEATYHQYVAPNGETMVMPSATTLFFMAMNPKESGLVNANGELGSGAGFQLQLAGQIAGGNGSQILSSLFQNLGGIDRVSADLFADAAINGQNAWSLFSPNTDVSKLLGLFYRLSVNDGNLYLLAMLYQSCSTSPAGCPSELCAANPVACGLPPTTEPEPTPTEPPSCPGPSSSQGRPSISISPTGPDYPLAVGQDPDKRGADISGRISIPPVIFTWYEPIYEEVESCSAAGPKDTTNCTRPNGLPGVTETSMEFKECKVHRETLPEQINIATARAELSPQSRNWILNDLGSKWYGAYIHQGSFDLTKYGPMNIGCGGGTCSASIQVTEVPFADPGQFNLTITAGTNGTFWNGRQLTSPRTLTGNGKLKVYIVLPTLIDASTGQ